MSEKFTSLLAACAVTVVAFAATSPALAKAEPITVTAPAEDVVVRYVSYRDLNLAMDTHERVLVKRVRHAAKDLCTEAVPEGFQFMSDFLTCRVDAMDGAKPQIAQAVLRARQIATNGWSAIAPVAITVSAR